MTTKVVVEDEAQEVLIQVVSFFVEKEEYGVDILYVQEILRVPEMTRVPKAPTFLKGVINLRGRIVPVIDLRTRLGMASAPTTQQSRVVVVNDSGKVVGMIVDSMSEVLRIPESLLLPAPTSSNAQNAAEHIQSVAKMEDRLLIFLKLESLLEADTY